MVRHHAADISDIRPHKLEDEVTSKIDESTDAKHGKYTILLALSVFSSCISTFQFGYNAGLPNTPAEAIKTWINRTLDPALFGTDFHGQKAFVDHFLYALFTSIFALGGFAGGLFSGYFADRYGRKRALLWNNSLALIASGLGLFARETNHCGTLIFSRLLVGLNCGITSGLVPLYVIEVSPVNLRGCNGAALQLAGTLGSFVAMFLGIKFESATSNWHVLGTDDLWPLIFGFIAIPSLIQLVLLQCCPESPKYTLINKQNPDQAEFDLKRLRRRTNVIAEMKIILEESNSETKVVAISWMEMFGYPNRWPLFVCTMLVVAEQMTGINAIMFYSTAIFEQMDRATAPLISTFAIGLLNVLMAAVSILLVERTGRRALLLAGLFGMFLTTTGMTVFIELRCTWSNVACMLCVSVFIMCFASGPGSIPSFYASEVFPQASRGKASSIVFAIQWFLTLAVAMTFSYVMSYLNGYAFLIFAACNLSALVFVFFFVPETKGRTTEEMVEHFANRNYLAWSQTRRSSFIVDN